jgi:hypothetical protein
MGNSARSCTDALRSIVSAGGLCPPRSIRILGSERAHVAQHEGGHVVMAVLGGLGLRHARIAPEPEVLTNWMLNRMACIEQRARFYLAGYCSDRRYAPNARLAREQRGFGG